MKPKVKMRNSKLLAKLQAKHKLATAKNQTVGDFQIIGEMDYFTTRSLSNFLADADGDIEIGISSPGGLATEGVAGYNLLRNYGGGKVTTTVFGVAASAAAMMALGGDNRQAFESGIFLYHNAYNYVIGNAAELRAEADALDLLDAQLAGILVERTGVENAETALSLMGEDRLISATDALDLGGISGIIGAENQNETDDEDDEEDDKPFNQTDDDGDGEDDDDAKNRGEDDEEDDEKRNLDYLFPEDKHSGRIY